MLMVAEGYVSLPRRGSRPYLLLMVGEGKKKASGASFPQWMGNTMRHSLATDRRVSAVRRLLKGFRGLRLVGSRSSP